MYNDNIKYNKSTKYIINYGKIRIIITKSLGICK